MRIFIVCSKLGGGGAEHVAALLATGFSLKKHQVYVITNLFEKIDYSVAEQVTLLKLFPRASNKYMKWSGAVFLLRRHIQTYSPDVIIGIMGACTLVSKLAAIGKKIPIIMTEHYAFERPEYAPFTFTQKVFKFYINRIYDCVTVLTEADKKAIGSRIKRVYVIPNPLAINPCTEIAEKKNKILAVGRLDGWFVKGFDVLIKAWGMIAANYPEWTLEIAGTGKDQSVAFLDKLIEENGVVDRAKLAGFQNDIKGLYHESSIFVLSSRYEGFGLALIEAMAQRCACIACDYGGRQREIIKDNGVICPPDNVNALAQAMKKIINDKRYRETLQKNAPKQACQYDLMKIVEQWEKLLKIVVTK